VRIIPSVIRKRLKPYFPHLHQVLQQELVGSCESILDVGCGSSSPLQVLTRKVSLTVGVDAFQPSLDASAAAGFHTRYEKLDLLDIAKHFGPRSFDAAVALDVIEHFEKPDGFRLLEAMEAVARKKVIIFTPNGFLPQGAEYNNPWQVHRSGWTTDDFTARGYRVIGLNGLKPLRGELASPRVRPAWLGGRLSQLSQPLVTHAPRLAFQLFAVLDRS
jgi:SAM-dependent methyltransferase